MKTLIPIYSLTYSLIFGHKGYIAWRDETSSLKTYLHGRQKLNSTKSAWYTRLNCAYTAKSTSKLRTNFRLT